MSEDSIESENDVTENNTVKDSTIEPVASVEPVKEPRAKRKSSASKTAWSSTVEGIAQELKLRLEEARPQLTSKLTGAIALVFDRKGSILFTQSSGSFTGEVLKKAPEKVDCKISLSHNSFTLIATGKLNPQLAMMSDKIAIEGDAERAVYFFNLLNERSR